MVFFHSDFLPIAPPFELSGVEMAMGFLGSGKGKLHW